MSSPPGIRASYLKPRQLFEKEILPAQILIQHPHPQTSSGRKQTICINSHNKKKKKKKGVIQCYTERQQNTFPSDQMYSLRKISNHPNSQTSLHKLLGKSSVPCHITHIYQDAA